MDFTDFAACIAAMPSIAGQPPSPTYWRNGLQSSVDFLDGVVEQHHYDKQKLIDSPPSNQLIRACGHVLVNLTMLATSAGFDVGLVAANMLLELWEVDKKKSIPFKTKLMLQNALGHELLNT
jgi:hypothetical protein